MVRFQDCRGEWVGWDDDEIPTVPPSDPAGATRRRDPDLHPDPEPDQNRLSEDVRDETRRLGVLIR